MQIVAIGIPMKEYNNSLLKNKKYSVALKSVAGMKNVIKRTIRESEKKTIAKAISKTE